MFDTYEYLNSIYNTIPGIGKVYRVSGLSGMEELAEDIRDMASVCVAADVGADGVLNIASGVLNISYNTFHVLACVDPTADQQQRNAAMALAFSLGRTILFHMQKDSHELEKPCYGLDITNVNYSRILRAGMNCVGYTFSFVINTEYER